MMLLDKRITKALISPRGRAGWSAPVLFAQTPKERFSRVEGFFKYVMVYIDNDLQVHKI